MSHVSATEVGAALRLPAGSRRVGSLGVRPPGGQLSRPQRLPSPVRYPSRLHKPFDRQDDRVKTLALPERFKWLKDSGYLANLLERGDIPLSHSDRLTGGLSEVSPWSKTGGLADVCGSLPVALAARGHRVMVVSPLYRGVGGVKSTGVTIKIDEEEVEYFHRHERGVDWVFVSHVEFFGREGLYGDGKKAYKDNLWRFRLLSLATLEAPLALPLQGSRYGEDVMLVANDWQTAMVPLLMRAQHHPNGTFLRARCSLIVHNMRHQGVENMELFPKVGIAEQWKNVLEYIYPDSVGMNVLKAGIETADRVVTVSRTYAEEIQQTPHGWGLEFLLASKARDDALTGVVNGIDVEEWNPETDKYIPQNYSKTTFTKGKAACKAALQEELGLEQRSEAVVLGFIGRLDEQKGVDVLLEAVPWMVQQGCQIVCLGTGTEDLERRLQGMSQQFPGAAVGITQFDVGLSHRITAGVDILMMPSRFEPCGLNQIYAMRYGTPVIANATGGLNDTVYPYDPRSEKGTGWTFSPCEVGPLKHAVSTALDLIRDHPDAFWSMKYQMVRRDFSWDTAAAHYEALFREVMPKVPLIRLPASVKKRDSRDAAPRASIETERVAAPATAPTPTQTSV